jgi:hypothetical protein
MRLRFTAFQIMSPITHQVNTLLQMPLVFPTVIRVSLRAKVQALLLGAKCPALTRLTVWSHPQLSWSKGGGHTPALTSRLLLTKAHSKTLKTDKKGTPMVMLEIPWKRWTLIGVLDGRFDGRGTNKWNTYKYIWYLLFRGLTLERLEAGCRRTNKWKTFTCYVHFHGFGTETGSPMESLVSSTTWKKRE